MKRTAAMTLVFLAAGIGLAGCGSSGKNGSDRADASILSGGLVVRPSALYLVSMDDNSDFRVDRAEFASGIQAAFTSADVNGSGFLTPIELADWSETLAGDRYAPPGFMAFDADGNQKITQQEFDEVLTDLFNRFDRNDDDVVTRPEMVERLQRLRGGGAKSRPAGTYRRDPRRRRR